MDNKINLMLFPKSAIMQLNKIKECVKKMEKAILIDKKKNMSISISPENMIITFDIK